MNPLAFALAMTAALCWGTAQVLGKLALLNLSALTFNAIRFSFVAAVIVAVALLSGGLDGYGVELILLAVGTGVLGWFIGGHLFFYSMKRSPAHRIIPAGNAYPFWVIVFAPLLLGEVVKPLLPISAALVIGGAFLLVPVRKKSRCWMPGIALASLTAFIWGLNAVLSKFALEEGMGPITLLAISILSAAVLFDLAAWARRPRGGLRLSRRSVGLSLASGAVAFPIGHLGYLAALGMERVSALAPITASAILFGFLLSLILVGERPTRRAVLGMGLTFSGVLLATL